MFHRVKYIIAIVINIPFLGGALSGLISLVLVVGFLVIWILLMVKAFQGERFKLPILGDLAEEWSKNKAR